MFLFKFNKVVNPEIYNKIFKYIIEQKLYGISEIILYPDLKKEGHKIKGIIYSYMVISLNDLKDMDEYAIEDLIFDFVENKDRIVFDTTGASDELIETVKEIVEDAELSVEWTLGYDFSRKPDLSSVDALTMSTILEIFEMAPRFPSYSQKNFLIQWTVEHDGTLKDNTGKEFGNVLDMDMLDMFFLKTSDYNAIKKASQHLNENSVLSLSVGSILPFLGNDEGINEKILEYKASVFEAIKNIKPSQYANMDSELCELLNSMNYIQFDDVVKIIKGDDYLGKSKEPIVIPNQ